MKRIYFTCGPSQLYPTFKNHLKKAISDDIASISHRSSAFQEIYKSAQNSLRQLLSIPQSHRIFFLSSSLESMERIIQNCVEKYSLHFVNGSFSRKFYQFAQSLKKKPYKYEVEEGSGYDPTITNLPKNNELICITHNETSTGVAIPVQSINLSASLKARRLDSNKKSVLVAVDIVSSAPYVNLDFKKTDLAFFSVQKGFGMPAGLSVLIVGPRAIEKSAYLERKGLNIGSFHSFTYMLEKDKIFQTPETPNVLGIYLLSKITQDMLKKGIKKIRSETDEKAKIVYDFFTKHPMYKPAVQNPIFRSKTTIDIDLNGNNKKFMAKLKAKGIVVSSGYGKFKQTHIRIANFPAHSIKDFNKLLKLISYN